MRTHCANDSRTGLIVDNTQIKSLKAVALQWDRRNAPRVTAIGKGYTAAEIMRVAEEEGIPLQSNPVLVEALAQIPLGNEIPQSLYVAVAEVLTFIFMLEGIDPYQTTLPD
ncbi:MAG: EscU/YscU/HrcU family type III secretion system export apparatus switch protein [Chromatium okenii]|nr:EscU/YscU/HrcU family type III secretion system export apparatus switch protein [Chromatium okenii]